MRQKCRDRSFPQLGDFESTKKMYNLSYSSDFRIVVLLTLSTVGRVMLDMFTVIVSILPALGAVF